ncbi:hypothetical protein RJ640_013898 [Escallonia rubra]|uniref:rhamnogalacturonan endolyase n=1 Tax=Escallonia rubra TaxID=112253 RepID=A0AA88S4P3_9ASTE|nr:hypothetical protein RJ640_013898 [Escallonia rubra]
MDGDVGRGRRRRDFRSVKIRAPPAGQIDFSDLSPSRQAAVASMLQLTTLEGFASLLLGISLALMLCGSVTFFIGFMWQIPGLHLLIEDHQVVMDNGFVKLTLSAPEGLVTGISYKGVEVLENRNDETDRGYWDIVWNNTSAKSSFQMDKFVMLPQSSGFYTYAILERLQGWPDFDVQEARIAFKLQQNIFHYIAMSDERQRIMPMPVDRSTGKVLDYPEAVLLTHPINPDLKDEVDDKYFYSCDNKDSKVHGWISKEPPIGFWLITPSNEFRTGGPVKQDLTSHVGPTTLSMFVSTHYTGEELALMFRNGEPWKKVLGPVFVYLNSDNSAKENPNSLWEDAKERMLKETASWPYSFPLSKDFSHSDERGTVRGQLLVHDRYISKGPMPANQAYVGLAPPGEAGSWQRESKGYQFWSQADPNGSFVINNVIAGSYNLYAWVPGVIGDYRYDRDITIRAGADIKLELVYEPPRAGPTLWEIGVPDRSAAEFYVPDPSPSFKIHKYKDDHVDKFRQYGLWARYTDLYPQSDLVYTVGSSNYKRDWFFAHVNKHMGNLEYQGTTWKILFDLNSVDKDETYALRIALASAADAELQIWFNTVNDEAPDFTTGLIGKDNAIARHGIHGLYWLFSVEVKGSKLVKGTNTIFLKQSRDGDTFRGVMYDYIRLEGPVGTP